MGSIDESDYWLKTEKRFWAKVDKDGPIHPTLGTSCWKWNGGLVGGYGMFYANRKSCYAHRFSWDIHFGMIKNGLFVCHHCDNKSCVRPSHLFLGTQKDNLQDARRKGRMNGAVSLGSKNPNSVLTEELVLEIRRRYALGGITLSQLAREHGVKVPGLSCIIRRERWKHI